MRTYQLQTGNLPESLAKTAVTYTDRKSLAPAPENMRWCFVGYKVRTGTPADAVLPASFAVLLSNDVQVSDVEVYEKFKDALVNDYQDKMVHEVADKKSIVDPADMDALIADYFDTTRNRLVPTLAEVMEWYDGAFVEAYKARVAERNEQTIKANDGKPQSEAETKRIVDAYRGYVRNIKTNGPLSENILRGVRQTIDKLIELEWLEKDTIASFLLDKINEHFAAAVGYTESNV